MADLLCIRPYIAPVVPSGYIGQVYGGGVSASTAPTAVVVSSASECSTGYIAVSSSDYSMTAVNFSLLNDYLVVIAIAVVFCLGFLAGNRR